MTRTVPFNPAHPASTRRPLVANCLRAVVAFATVATSLPSVAQVVTPAAVSVATTTPVGEVKGHAFVHDAVSAKAVLDNAWLALPARATGGVPYFGRLADAPPAVAKVPVVVFAHGSSGIAPAIKTWQQWLALDVGVASLTPDSMQLKDRITYKSPVSKEVYEKVHALRAQEIALAVAALPTWAWADSQKLVIAGTSEGAVSIARYQKQSGVPTEIGRMVYSWSCENNYHVAEHRTQLPAALPVLNVMSSTDVYFSQSNPWLGNPQALGHCGTALKDSTQSSVVLIPGAPHTLFNLPQAKGPTAAFLRELVGR